ncbi:MAG: hypothetical protein WAX37_02770 [Minisyncoccia bacterium]
MIDAVLLERRIAEKYFVTATFIIITTELALFSGLFSGDVATQLKSGVAVVLGVFTARSLIRAGWRHLDMALSIATK